MLVRGIAVVTMAAALGGCSHVSSMWDNLRHRGGDTAHSLAEPAASPAPAAPSADMCAKLAADLAASTEPASRQLPLDEMRRIGCPETPSS